MIDPSAVGPVLESLAGRVIYFPVRHHSPTASRLVGELIDALRPAAVLIEGPADFNPRMPELFLPHRLPIAIYSYLLLAAPDGTQGQRRGVYYPLCSHSPEWQAAQKGHASGAAVRFIDLPWVELVQDTEDHETNRYADRHFQRGRFSKLLCERLGVDSFNDAWDTLCEVDPALNLAEYLRRCHRLCTALRAMDGPVSSSDTQREAFMAREIRAALAEFAGPILVVTGGYHSAGLFELLQREEGPPEPTPPAEPLKVLDRGIALTPYSFERLDSLTGYDSGMPNPGFYHELWKARERGLPGDVHSTLLKLITLHLRDAKQTVSAADLIAAETTARALAGLRGHPHVWRTDLLDGLMASLVKDDLQPGIRHPVLEAIHAVLRGGERGVLAAGTALPPLVADIRQQVERHHLQTTNTIRTVEVKLASPEERQRSRTLHQLRLLALGGYDLVGSTLEEAEAPELMEVWELQWHPDFDAHGIEASRYGATLPEATAACLVESATQASRDAALASKLVLDACLAGLEELTDQLLATVRRLIVTDANFFNMAVALRRLLTLYRYDQALGTTGRPDLGQLLRETFDRAIWLLESLGQTRGQEEATIDGIRTLLDTFERCDQTLDLNRVELIEAFQRVTQDAGQNPIARGATLGALWILGETDGASVTLRLREFGNPDRLGDFLAGVFALAREQVIRHTALLLAVNDLLGGYQTEEFLLALPALRLAFTSFTPREKHQLALTLRQALGLAKEPEMAALSVTPETAAQAMAFEERLFALAKKYGIRTGKG